MNSPAGGQGRRFLLAIRVPDREKLKTCCLSVVWNFMRRMALDILDLPILPARQFLPGNLPVVNHATLLVFPRHFTRPP
jgi:hypothetical protein